MQTIGKIINGKYVRYGAVSVGDKLGDAAFANIVNNATTTEEGFVPDARVVAQQQQIITQQQEQIDSLNSAWEATDLRINGKPLYTVNAFFSSSPTGLSYFVTTTSFAEDNRPDTSYKWGAGTGILLKRSVAEGTIILFEYGTNRYAIGSIVNSSFTGWAIK